MLQRAALKRFLNQIMCDPYFFFQILYPWNASYLRRAACFFSFVSFHIYFKPMKQNDLFWLFFCFYKYISKQSCFFMGGHVNGDALFCYVLLHFLDSAVKLKSHVRRRFKVMYVTCVENATFTVKPWQLSSKLTAGMDTLSQVSDENGKWQIKCMRSEVHFTFNWMTLMRLM